MSQNDFNIANQGFPSFRTDLNSALQALASCSSGSAAPTTTYANMLWMDTANNKLKVRNEDNDAWIDLFDLNQTADTAMLAGVTATVAELNVLDGITSSTAELNILDGANPTIAAALLATPQNYLDPENRIINGAFDFWQRGTSFTTNVYGADRWVNVAIGGSVTMSRQLFAAGDTLGSNNPTFYLRQSVSGQTLASHAANVTQRIEGVRTYAGQTITLLGWARRSSGSGNMAVDGFQFFGTGGSPSSVVSLSPQTVTLTGSWSPFAVTFTVPSIAGKTLGTSGDDYLAFRFWTSAGSDFNASTNSLGLQTIGVDLWGIHIKVGTHTTAAVDLYRAPELGPELARCQRYYEKSYEIGTAPGAITTVGLLQNYNPSGSTSTAALQVIFKVQKRGAPTVTSYSSATGASGQVRDGSGSDRTATVQYVSTGGAHITNSAVGNAANYSAHWVADAEL